MSSPTIFIPLAACKEPYLITTIKSAISSAKIKDRIYFGVFHTLMKNDVSLDDEIINLQKEFPNLDLSKKIVYVSVNSESPLGVGMSRLNASLLYNKNHDYFLQIDSHILFEKNWDEILINSYLDILEKYQTDFVISSAPQSATRIENGFIDTKDGFLIEENGHTSFKKSAGIVSSSDYSNLKHVKPKPFYISYFDWFNNDEKYRETNSICASMLFGPFSFMKDFLHDPKDNFYGDQINFTLRCISRNWKIFSVQNPCLYTIEKYKKIEGLDKISYGTEYDWRTCFDSIKKNLKTTHDFVQNQNREAIVFRHKIFSGSYFGYWGAPEKESLNRAKKILGID